MIAFAFVPGSGVLTSGASITRLTRGYLRFHLVTAPESSRVMPRASRSVRIRSASAKLRAMRAARRASISCSISSTGTGGRVQPREEVGQPLERFLRLRHRRPRELQLLAVMDAEIQVAQRRRAIPLR